MEERHGNFAMAMAMACLLALSSIWIEEAAQPVSD